jgi:acyl-CoA reductase-like NAD-dependent aldehyde dehydrogenase
MDVDKISLTGSTEVGKLMMVCAGQPNLKRVTVETGGKSPQIITATAPDLDRAVDYAVSGIFANKGVACSAESRLLVDASLHNAFVERFLARTAATIRLGDPLGPDTTMGRSSTAPSNNMCFRTSIEGAKITLGRGTPPDLDAGAYVEPTLFVSIAPTIGREEIRARRHGAAIPHRRRSGRDGKRFHR